MRCRILALRAWYQTQAPRLTGTFFRVYCFVNLCGSTQTLNPKPKLHTPNPKPQPETAYGFWFSQEDTLSSLFQGFRVEGDFLGSWFQVFVAF